ncbi:MAG: hypothetical protein JWQ29_2293 [Phenylobacterium sp.]|nr:hypothetical protein [Phenylobacterium sp.]
MITTVSNTAALNAALKVAQGGDTIQLTAGTYTGVVADNLHFAQDVTITSAGATQAVLTNLNINKSAGLTLSNLEFQVSPGGGDNPFTVYTSQDIHFDRLNVHGSLDGNPWNDVNGIMVRFSSDFSVTNSEFQQLKNGVTYDTSEHVLVSGNELHDINGDGIHGVGSSWVTITGNMLHDFHSAPGAHSDAIQFWTTGTTTAAHDITVTDNIYLRGSGTAAQGVFMNDEAGVHYQNVVISNNTLIGTQYNGIAIANGDGVTISNNTVMGFGSMKSWIRLGGGDGATITNNTVNAVVMPTVQTNVVQTGTTLLPTASDDGEAVYQKWLAANLKVLTSLATEGADKLTATPGFVEIHGGAGDDTISSIGVAGYLRGDDGNDVINGGSAADDINGNMGNDILHGGDGSDCVVGGKDNDAAFGDAGADTVWGNLGNDTLDGGDGNDQVRGGQGDDSVSGGAGDDFVSGDRGNDTISGGLGADTFHGSQDAGMDRVLDFKLSEGDRVMLDAGTTYTVAQVGADTVIDMGAGNQMVLVGVQFSTLTPGWIFGA